MMCDSVMMYKYVCKNVAARHGKPDIYAQAALSRTMARECTRLLFRFEGKQAIIRGE